MPIGESKSCTGCRICPHEDEEAPKPPLWPDGRLVAIEEEAALNSGLATPGVYEHFKGGRYTLLHVGQDAERSEERRYVVVYVSHKTGEVWTRPLRRWVEMVDVNGTPDKVRRFQRVS